MVHDWDLEKEMDEASEEMQAILKNETLATPDNSEETIKDNKKIFKEWLLKIFHDKEYKKYFGFSKETFKLDIWPAFFCLKPILAKIQLRSPGLIKMKNSDGDLVYTDFCYELDRKFETERVKRKNKLKLTGKIVEKKKGTYFFMFTLQS